MGRRRGAVMGLTALFGFVALLAAAACVPSPGPQGPSIEGDPVVGTTLTAHPGEWWFDPTNYSFSWSSCGVAAPVTCTDVGDGSTTYVPTASDVGRNIRVSVRATNAVGTSESRSASVGPVVAPGGTTTSTTIPDNTGTTAIGVPTTVTTTVSGEDATRTFTGTAGQGLTMTVSGNTFSGGVTLTVRHPGGGAVASLTVSDPTGWEDLFVLPATGTYTIEIDPAGDQVGSVTFLLTPVPDNTGNTSIGSPTTVVTTVAGENATRGFTGTAGQKLTLSVSGNTFASGVTLTIRQSGAGATIASLLATSPTALEDVFTLPATGSYVLTIDPLEQQTGSVTFLLSSVPDNTGATSIGTPTLVTTTVAGEVATRTFTGTAGQNLTLSVSGNTFSTGAVLTLRPAGGGAVIANLLATGATAVEDVFTLPATGTYTLTIDPLGTQTGSLTFTLNAVPDNTGTTSIGTPTLVTTTVAGEVATRTFVATAGQELSLSVSGNSFSSGVSIAVRQPGGGIVRSLLVTAPTQTSSDFTLPVTGTYTVEVDPLGTQTGSVTFLLDPA